MYQYKWDTETGGILLTTEVSNFSKEPRPVYYKELDILGFSDFFTYPKDDSAPIMWAEASNYIYRGITIAKTKGGSLYNAPELIILDKSETELKPVDIPAMVYKNKDIIENLSQEMIQRIYNIYRSYNKKVDIFYVAFSGGKDSVVAFDLVQRALPHNDFKVVFGDTRMEFPDTYEVVEKQKEICEEKEIDFYISKSKLAPEETWNSFGPPSTSNRWCCSVHKTSPQINLLRNILGNYHFTGMAFTGVRAQESLKRSEYDIVTKGEKHSGQYSCHVILEWNSAELFTYIFSRGLLFNKAYKKGIARAGCLVCPNSSGRNEYMKKVWYNQHVDFYLNIIANTSGKTNYSDEDMKSFIDAGFWRTRKTGRELNFGQDKFEFLSEKGSVLIRVFKDNFQWQDWGKTIGNIVENEKGLYKINFINKFYMVQEYKESGITVLQILNCDKSKQDTKFVSLFRSVVVKSIYCVGCGACEAECKYKCINMKDGVVIGDNCVHCYKCHEIHEHCLRYNSIRNKLVEGKNMTGLDRYFSFGVREEWLDSFVKHNGNADFWLSDGDGVVVNKKKDAFKNFVIDAGIVKYDKRANGDKYTKCLLTDFGKVIIKMGAYSSISWSLILCNLAYTPAYNWFVKKLDMDVSYSPDAIKDMLAMDMENDTKGLGRRNVVDALKIVMGKTLLGKDRIFADCDIDAKVNRSGEEKLLLKSFRRCRYGDVKPEVILYSMYMFAEYCGEYFQFSLTKLMDYSIEREGVSPTQIFGLKKEDMIKILNGLAVNYPDYISVSFTLDMDNITLRDDKSSFDVLKLF